jgi:hypothetical protein
MTTMKMGAKKNAFGCAAPASGKTEPGKRSKIGLDPG